MSLLRRVFTALSRPIVADRARLRYRREHGLCEICGNHPRLADAADCRACYIDGQAW